MQTNRTAVSCTKPSQLSTSTRASTTTTAAAMWRWRWWRYSEAAVTFWLWQQGNTRVSMDEGQEMCFRCHVSVDVIVWSATQTVSYSRYAYSNTRSVNSLVNSMRPSEHRKQPIAVTLGCQESYIRKVTYKPSKLGQTDHIFGLWLEFISTIGPPVHAGLQVSAFSLYDFMSPWLTHRQIDRQLLITCTISSTSWAKIIATKHIPLSKYNHLYSVSQKRSPPPKTFCNIFT